MKVVERASVVDLLLEAGAAADDKLPALPPPFKMPLVVVLLGIWPVIEGPPLNTCMDLLPLLEKLDPMPPDRWALDKAWLQFASEEWTLRVEIFLLCAYTLALCVEKFAFWREIFALYVEILLLCVIKAVHRVNMKSQRPRHVDRKQILCLRCNELHNCVAAIQ